MVFDVSPLTVFTRFSLVSQVRCKPGVAAFLCLPSRMSDGHSSTIQLGKGSLQKVQVKMPVQSTLTRPFGG